MGLSQLLRLLLQKCAEWGLPLLICKGDIHRAFDSMRHDFYFQALVERDFPLALCVAFLRELSDVDVTIHLGGTVTEDDICLCVGGKQGSVDTPFLWNLYLDHTLTPTIKRWTEQGIRFRLPPDPGSTESNEFGYLFNHAFWADDLYFYARSSAEMTDMLYDVTAALEQASLKWKQAGDLM